jgi:diadenylate cyclase
MDFLNHFGLTAENMQATLAAYGWLNVVRTCVEALIIAYAIVWLWKRIKGTQAERLVKGVLVLTFLCFLSWLAGFTLITNFLQQLIPIAVLAILIVFQPEIRRGLGYLGRGRTFKFDWGITDTQKFQSQIVIDQIIDAVRDLSRSKIGALIVVEPPEGERDYLSPGTPINADVSATLLLNIFYPNTPLHDGAAVIRKNKIVAAGVILHTITENQKLNYRYGSRHRAALGLSEIYDGLCIVVSEETGSISAASRGMLVRYATAEELSEPLSYLYEQGSDTSTPNPLHFFFSLFSRVKKEESATAGSVTFPKPQVKQSLEEQAQERQALKELESVGNVRDIESAGNVKDIEEDPEGKKATV